MPAIFARCRSAIDEPTRLFGGLVPGTRLLRLILAWLALLPAVVMAQERREVTFGTPEAPVAVYADRIENLDREHLLIAEGRVEIEQGEIRLEADRVEVNTETGEAVAVGKVVFFDGRDRLNGERLEYSFRTGTGVVYRGEGAAEPHFFFRGDKMERFGEKAYRLTGGWFTTCEDEAPAWHVRWGQATAYLDDWIWGTNASFWVSKIPMIPFIPFFYASLRKDRQSGLLSPIFGSSSDKGFTYRQPIYLVLSDSQDLTLVPTVYAKRGFGLGASYRYILTETSRGEMEGFGLYDTKLDEARGVVGWRHEQLITPGLTLKIDAAHVSDNAFFQEFGDTLDQRSRQRLESNISLTQRWDKWNLFGRLFFYQDLTTTQPVELQRLPELRLTAFSQRIAGSDVLFDLESSYNNFVREVGSNGQRLDIHPTVSYPFSPGGYLTLTPRVGFRETLYDTRVIGTTVDHGFLVEDTEREFTNRSLVEAGLSLEARAFRTYDLGGFLGIEKIQHAIEPRISYLYLTGTDQGDLPQFDAIDLIAPTNGITYSLTNRIKARGVSSEAYPQGRVWELARLTFSQAYSLDVPSSLAPILGINQPAPTTPTTPTTTTTSVTPPRLSDLVGDLILEPVYGLQFRGTAAFDPYARDVRSATIDVSYVTEAFRVTLGTRHGQGGALEFIQGELVARLSSRWSFRFASNYDYSTGTVVENRFEVNFREQCWSITAGFVDRTTDNEFRISVNLLELGQFGFAQALGALTQ
jgi:LPS-assembly protein